MGTAIGAVVIIAVVALAGRQWLRRGRGDRW
jgi:hypothetical protein